MSLHTPICDLFEIEHPVLLAGMGRVAYAEVCAAVSQAGGYGTLGMAGSGPDEIRQEMRAVRRLSDKPFGVDLLAALPEKILAFPAQMAESTRMGVFSFAADEPVDPARTCMPSGQGVGGIDEILPAGEIVRRVVEEAAATIGRLGTIVEGGAAEAGR